MENEKLNRSSKDGRVLTLNVSLCSSACYRCNNEESDEACNAMTDTCQGNVSFICVKSSAKKINKYDCVPLFKLNGGLPKSKFNKIIQFITLIREKEEIIRSLTSCNQLMITRRIQKLIVGAHQEFLSFLK